MRNVNKLLSKYSRAVEIKLFEVSIPLAAIKKGFFRFTKSQGVHIDPSKNFEQKNCSKTIWLVYREKDGCDHWCIGRGISVAYWDRVEAERAADLYGCGYKVRGISVV